MLGYRTPTWLLNKTKSRTHEVYFRSPLSKLGKTRQAHVYCLGTAKSGTHSIAELFSGELRTFHEADWQKVIPLVLGVAEGHVEPQALRSRLIRRDHRYKLDIDSSQLNYFYMPELVQLFPQARFILTIRDPYSWLDSYINHQLARGKPPPVWQQLRDHRFKQNRLPHPPEEQALAKRGLYTLDSYLSYWARHNQDVLKIVPQSRLLIVRTDKISQRFSDIAQFIGVAPQNVEISVARSHAFKALRKYNVLSEVDAAYLANKIEIHCSDLMRQFFPDKIDQLELR